MTTEVRCPHCQARFAVPAEMLGRESRCGGCQKLFTPAAAPPAAARLPVAAKLPPAAPPRSGLRPVPTIAPVTPPAKSRKGRDDDEDEDDEDDDRPRRGKRPAKGGLNPLLIGGMAVGAVVVLGGIALLVARGLSPEEKPGPAPAFVPPEFAQTPPPRQTNPPDRQPDPTPPEAPAPAPKDPVGAVARVKASTVYIRTHIPGALGMGSGFFAGQPGYVVTNAHVIGYSPDGDFKNPTKVQVVVDSGEPTQVVLESRIVGIDVPNDLALLWVDPKANKLPPPLPFGKSAELALAQEVLIFGFPHGEQLGLNISVNKSTVSSLRKDSRTGQIEVVQVAGGMHPGNSGGPVADKTGQIIGVSAAGLKGEAINFAIPAEITVAFVRDRIANPGKFDFGTGPTGPGPRGPGPRGPKR